ncbi:MULTISPECIES: type II secretion system protein [Vibrio]|jgi:MSHA pilin protein MshA|uniref:Type II secretion system protein n=2 Tax=Vibrio TaxID=662 RepID=A0ABW7IL91_9VIBR|nr:MULTISPECIES: type II secretion system protein [Vibrio]AYV21856.1 type II secretion system protein [Vibrio mediterranei]EDL53984.1 MshA, mannose-sensitive haemaglutinin [Vibrio mediterranei AK1]MCF4171918.1 type II secretion system GspH family protein [Vibrio sp. McD22-P3]MCG9623853.1 type II secretion system GspH family protein [Vibrio mediterranei]MCG9664221.1 type II secretion system GspH family protein [Vibrio mediterranei]|eukprot:TRINITY_DN6442_c0_g1_i2.p2 TRINITY_DN6442_c0_g1~~TRINITY_DN6442_c0_g1_i2.p2  ORF type:complete len:159 (-),score=30.31 TRINITY_DN6442_c0_g1_i2:311-787(-)
MKRQSGFTLIEMVVVIVILGILAVTAAPRFLNLQGDARESSLNGLKGAISGANGIVYGKAAVEGVEQQATATINAGTNEAVTVAFGYPTADAAGLVSAVDGLQQDWMFATRRDALIATFDDGSNANFRTIRQSNCFVRYDESTQAGTAPRVTVEASGC